MISGVIVAPLFIAGIAIGSKPIQQAMCLIGWSRIPITVDGFTREMDLVRWSEKE
jgi:hypothetical protein